MFEKLLDSFRIWGMGKYCKEGSVIIISHIGKSMRSSRYVMTGDDAMDDKNVQQLGKIAARTVRKMKVDLIES